MVDCFGRSKENYVPFFENAVHHSKMALLCTIINVSDKIKLSDVTGSRKLPSNSTTTAHGQTTEMFL
ncbi:hypothetical protein T11_18379 [Trichinella zimbabwensis]|uniref:Uncharacterized protein n=1 Tax=Trichinella zimbabwensis TaxID=268475 RepID=A0A0V1H846_9BILA|nr:hypothetical protein T11_18379 [Trichinella zimbabwensis]